MRLSYLGTHYSGWQIQDNSISIQGAIMDALHKLLTPNIPLIVGAGRTDSGVHAMNFIAHVESEAMDHKEIKYKLNRCLPKDIVIHDIKQVPYDFHARYSAVSRKYEYWISTQKDPFLIDRAYFFSKNLNMELMNQGASLLVGKKDFSAFSKSKESNNFCEIISASWFKSKNMLIFSIEADRFLYNMVRCIVGTLIDLGLQKIKLNDLKSIIASKNRSKSGYSVPASGLYLLDIKYPKKYKLEKF
tara:strand:+ start:932 stop:1666 length:735 start_codon:yes stop_codon:yes gene_type:complete